MNRRKFIMGAVASVLLKKMPGIKAKSGVTTLRPGVYLAGRDVCRYPSVAQQWARWVEFERMYPKWAADLKKVFPEEVDDLLLGIAPLEPLEILQGTGGVFDMEEYRNRLFDRLGVPRDLLLGGDHD